MPASNGNLGTLTPPTQAFAPTAGDTTGGLALEKFVSNLIAFMTVIGGLIFLIYFLTAALEWISSGGDKGKVEHAKTQMTNGAIGLIIVIAAYSIVGIVGRVLGLDILNPAKIISTLKPV
ncbi:MAG TPA: hypothetical protein VLH19_04480 [Patescibacteria group bacterium]|nr:hypothetical protein [Patescibacteria group bacterium]